MTRSNLYITLSNGQSIEAVADSSSTPEQGYIVESLLLLLLSFDEPDAELSLLNQHRIMNGQCANATYRYETNFHSKTPGSFKEIYPFKTGKFRRGKDLTRRYNAYLLSTKNQNLIKP